MDHAVKISELLLHFEMKRQDTPARQESELENSYVILYEYAAEQNTETIVFCGDLVRKIATKPATETRLLDIQKTLAEKTQQAVTLNLADAERGKIDLISQNLQVSYKHVANARDKILRMLRHEATLQRETAPAEQASLSNISD